MNAEAIKQAETMLDGIRDDLHVWRGATCRANQKACKLGEKLDALSMFLEQQAKQEAEPGADRA